MELALVIILHTKHLGVVKPDEAAKLPIQMIYAMFFCPWERDFVFLFKFLKDLIEFSIGRKRR